MKNSTYLKVLGFLCFFFCFSAEVIAQNIWTINEDNTFELNTNALSDKLKQAVSNTSTTIKFPDNNGGLSSFEVFDNSLLPESLAIKYPNVHAYKGKSIEFPDLSITFTCTSQGISATLIKGVQIWSLQQIEQTNSYEVIEDSDSLSSRINCDTKEAPNDQIITSNRSAKTLIGDNTLRILRTAIVVTGEYSSFFANSTDSEANQKAAVLGGIVSSLNNLNTVFERDLGIRFELVDNNDELIFLDANTDPFLSDDGNDLIDTGSQQISNIIGLDNIDIGHTLSIGFAGLAEVRALCSTRKAGAVSAGPVPQGTSFDFTLFAHELGHQLGANHTQNENCQRNNATAVEPGSGSTIMGYAGACFGFTEIQPISDEYFHFISIDQIKSHVQSVSCGIETSEVNNNNPVIEQLPDYTIPSNTFFELEAVVTDADNDALTYSWEQLDNEVGISPPVSTSEFGPLFRSLTPTSDPKRTFDTNSMWEVIPTVTRDMEFGLTVRDGNAGGIATSTLNVNVFASGEEFEVTAPLGGRFPQNSIIEITWNVAGTDANGIDTENVTIELSYDNGETFPVVLSESTPNDGSERVITPVGDASERVRVKITPINNIYYTISESSFSISEEVNDDLAPIPNPVRKDILIEVFKLQVPQYEFTLYDLAGHLLISQTLASNPDITEVIPIDISHLNEGVYVMKLVVGSQIHTRKIIKD